jgi:hypothetical protein
MSGDANAEVLTFARRAVLRAIDAATPEGAASAIDEDMLMRVVPLLEHHDPDWLRKVLADDSLPLAGRKEIHAYTGKIDAPWSAGKDRP